MMLILSFKSEKEAQVSVDNSHVVHIGRLVEEAENKAREALEAIYFAKTREISDTLRNILSTSYFLFFYSSHFSCFHFLV